MKNLSKYLFAAFCVFSLWACDQKSTSKSPVRTTRQFRDSQPNYNNSGISPYGNNTGVVPGGNNGAWGRIFSAYDNEFNIAIKALVSASFDPSKLGYVNPQNGVFIQGFIDGNQNAVNAYGSSLRIEIWDNYAASGQESAIPISFTGARSAQISGNQINLVFEDQYGSIILTGYINGNTITGDVSFRNNRSFDNVSQPREGVLGNFEVPTCSFLKCN
jgi:hypothetical protein